MKQAFRVFKSNYDGDAEDKNLKKSNLYFRYESRDTLRLFSLLLFVKNISELNMEHTVKFDIQILKIIRRRFAFSRQRRIWSCQVVVLQRTAKNYTKNYNGRSQPLYCSLKLLFSDVPVAVIVFLNSQMP